MPRYVVLEHRWGGVHWDLMLEREDGSALRTWAVDAPIAAGVELPARELPDHRPAYLDYEGPVSGDRGEVRRVDAGTYRAEEWGEGRVVAVLSGGQLAGTLELGRVPSGGLSPETSRTWYLRLGKVI